jgi:hypothetical protein
MIEDPLTFDNGRVIGFTLLSIPFIFSHWNQRYPQMLEHHVQLQSLLISRVIVSVGVD